MVLLIMGCEYEVVIFICISQDKYKLIFLFNKMVIEICKPILYSMVSRRDEIFDKHVLGRHAYGYSCCGLGHVFSS
ncbi:hypothetical protein D3C76_794330 [compost metagenome]